MAKKELVKYLKDGLNAGLSLDEMEKILLGEGWPHEFINEAKFEIRNDPRIRTHVNFNKNKGNFRKNDLSLLKYVSLLNYFSAFFIFVIGFFSLFFPNSIIPSFSSTPYSFGISLLIMGGFFLFSLFSIIVAKNILAGRSWARVVELIFSGLFALVSTFSIFNYLKNSLFPSLFVLIVFCFSYFVFIVLLFNKGIRGHFNNGR